jgi:hypothetical protein
MELITETMPVHKSTRKKEQFWEEQKRRQKESGLSGRGYCKKHQLSYRQFNYWSDKKTRQKESEVSKLMPVHIEELPKIISKRQSDTLCTLVFKRGCELKVHDQTLLPVLLSLLS